MTATPETVEADHTPEDYAPVLAAPAQPLVIGGQAINLWGTLYGATVPAIAALAPFLSHDADIIADAATVAQIATSSGWTATNTRRSFCFATLSQGDLKVDVLDKVDELSAAQLAECETIARDGQNYRVLSPVRLLQVKLGLTLRPFRGRDVEQAKQLVPMAEEYLRLKYFAKKAGQFQERLWIENYDTVQRCKGKMRKLQVA